MKKGFLQLYLGSDNSANNQATQLINKLVNTYDVQVFHANNVRIFMKNPEWPTPFIMVQNSCKSTLGGGGSFGVNGIQSFVEKELG